MASGARVEVRVARKGFATMALPLFVDLDFSVPSSKVLALVGPSGIGKTTLLRMMAGLDTRFDGSLEIDGTPADRAPTPGYVFQEPRLLPWLSAHDNIAAVAPRRTLAEIEALLTDVGLGAFRTALPGELSGGMQRRVALARALAVQPRLLLLDEPFVSLDAALTTELHGLFLRIAASYAPTAILVSHDPRDAARLADDVIVLGGQPTTITARLALTPSREARSNEDVARIVDRIASTLEGTHPRAEAAD